MEKRKKGKKSTPSNYVHIYVSIPFQLLSKFDEESERRGYNRSEAMRKAMRNLLETWTGREL